MVVAGVAAAEVGMLMAEAVVATKMAVPTEAAAMGVVAAAAAAVAAAAATQQ